MAAEQLPLLTRAPARPSAAEEELVEIFAQSIRDSGWNHGTACTAKRWTDEGCTCHWRVSSLILARNFLKAAREAGVTIELGPLQ